MQYDTVNTAQNTQKVNRWTSFSDEMGQYGFTVNSQDDKEPSSFSCRGKRSRDITVGVATAADILAEDKAEWAKEGEGGGGDMISFFFCCIFPT